MIREHSSQVSVEKEIRWKEGTYFFHVLEKNSLNYPLISYFDLSS